MSRRHRAMTVMLTVAASACKMQFRTTTGAGPGAPSEQIMGGERAGSGAQGASGRPSGPNGLNGPGLADIPYNYNRVMFGDASAEIRLQAAESCVENVENARSYWKAADTTPIDLEQVGGPDRVFPPTGATTVITLAQADKNCRDAMARARTEVDVHKQTAQRAFEQRIEKQLAPYRKVMAGAKLETVKRWLVSTDSWEIVGRDCAKFASPAAMAKASIWFNVSVVSEETSNRVQFNGGPSEVTTWSVGKIEWKGNALAREVPNWHSGHGAMPPARACR